MMPKEIMAEEGLSGLFLNLRDCKCLFRVLKREESKLRDEECFILQRIEKLLYSRLSIKEIEELTETDG